MALHRDVNEVTFLEIIKVCDVSSSKNPHGLDARPIYSTLMRKLLF